MRLLHLLYGTGIIRCGFLGTLNMVEVGGEVVGGHEQSVGRVYIKINAGPARTWLNWTPVWKKWPCKVEINFKWTICGDVYTTTHLKSLQRTTGAQQPHQKHISISLYFSFLDLKKEDPCISIHAHTLTLFLLLCLSLSRNIFKTQQDKIPLHISRLGHAHSVCADI